MANRNLRGMELNGLAHPVARLASRNKKQSNWFHSIVAGAGLLTLSSLGAVLIFDWYFFSVVDGHTTMLRPIAGAFHQVDDHAQSEPSPHLLDQLHSRVHFPVQPEGQQRHRADIQSVPVRLTANPKPSAN
jgi:hypothetical protein